MIHNNNNFDFLFYCCYCLQWHWIIHSVGIENFEFWSSSSRENGAHLYTFFTTWQKTGIFSQISQDILDRFLQSFYHMKALWVQMIDLYLDFRFVEGRCHGNQLILQKCHECRLIPLAFFALSFENKLHYHCLNVCINSGDDVAISCKNLVNFCQVTPEKMELICERQVRQRLKTGVFHWISPDILDGFWQYFHHMKALYVQMMDLYLIFQFVKGHCHGN